MPVLLRTGRWSARRGLVVNAALGEVERRDAGRGLKQKLMEVFDACLVVDSDFHHVHSQSREQHDRLLLGFRTLVGLWIIVQREVDDLGLEASQVLGKFADIADPV